MMIKTSKLTGNTDIFSPMQIIARKMTRPVLITVAPNGARKLKQDHPQLPLTAYELGETAAACSAAGAAMLHLHVRDKGFAHSLDPERYRAAINQIRQAAGPDLIIQITTEAVGRYQPAEQMASVKKTRPEAVSLALRELIPTPKDESAAAGFFQWLYTERIAPQYILYDEDDILAFKSLYQRGLVPDESIHVLLVLGRYEASQESDPAALPPLLAHLDASWLWSVCAFGRNESRCMDEAIKAGGHCRVGFENNLSLPDGNTASSNADLVRSAAELVLEAGCSVADPATARELLQVHWR